MQENIEFINQVTGEVCILPQGERVRSKVDAGLQTSRIKTRERTAQTTRSAFESGEQSEKGVNTELRTIPRTSLQGVQYIYESKSNDSSNNNNTDENKDNVDIDKLALFVEACQVNVLPIIQANAKGNSIFAHYTPNWSSTMREMSLLHTLSWESVLEKELQVIALCWNATNTLLAVAYGRTDRVGWCFDEGVVGVWNYMRSDFSPNAPHFTIELDSFPTAIAFHPTSTQTLAIGTYSGEVVVYENVTESNTLLSSSLSEEFNSKVAKVKHDNVNENYNNDIINDVSNNNNNNESNNVLRYKNLTAKQAVYSSKRGVWSHEETITQLQWVQNLHEVRDVHRFLLVASAADGVISYWTILNGLQFPVARYQVTNKHHKSVAVTAFSYTYPGESLSLNVRQRSPSLEGAIIIGLESGEVGRGRTNLFSISLDALLESKNNTSLKHDFVENTITPLELEWLDGHEGPVQSISTSMFFRHVFITAAADGSAHLYSSLARKPSLVLIPSSESNQFLYGAKFSPSRPSVVLLYARNSLIYLYDLQQDNNQPWRVMQGASEREVVTVASFATDSPYYLALGDGKGRVNVWELPSVLTETTEQERSTLYLSETKGEKSNSKNCNINNSSGSGGGSGNSSNAKLMASNADNLSPSPNHDVYGEYNMQNDAVDNADNAVAQLFRFAN